MHTTVHRRAAIGTQEDLDFFVSYTVADEAWAEWVAAQLEATGRRVLVQALDFRPGNNFVVRMNEGTSARQTVALLSPSYLGRAFPTAEWAAALAQDPTGANRRRIPVRIAPCDIDGLLGTVVFIDLVGLDEEAARTRLLDGILPGRAPRAGPPPFPPATPTNDIARGLNLPLTNVPTPEPLRDRADELAAIRAFMEKQGGPRPTVIALTGASGNGKTALARSFASSVVRERKLVWEVSGRDSLAVIEGMADLAERLGLPETHSGDQVAAAQAAQRWFAANDAWLLLVDDEEASPSIRALLPANGRGQILITSTTEAEDEVTAIRVDGLPLYEAINMLLEMSGSTDLLGAERLARALDCSPLLLTLAAAQCRARSESLAAMADEIEGADDGS